MDLVRLSVPSDIGVVNNSWFSSVLSDYYNTEVSIQCFEFNRITDSKRKGFCSNEYYVSVFGSINKVFRKLDMILKLGPDSGEPCYHKGDLTPFFVEDRIYKLYLPWTEMKMKKSLSVEHLYINQEDGGRGVVLLKDPAEEGFTRGTTDATLSLAQCKCIVESLARLHAIGHQTCHQGFRSFQFMNHQPQISHTWMDYFIGEIRGLLAVLLDCYSEYTIYLPAIQDIIHGCHQLYSSSLDTSDIYSTYIHGDMNSSNIYIRETGDTEVQIKFINWENSRQGLAYEELRYFIYSSTSPNFRQLHLPYILRHYYKTFMEENNLSNEPYLDFENHFYGSPCTSFVISLFFSHTITMDMEHKLHNETEHSDIKRNIAKEVKAVVDEFIGKGLISHHDSSSQNTPEGEV